MARLLLVDDEAGLRKGLAGSLRLSGHEVREAEGLRQALDLAGLEPPEMVITDLRMEDGTGLDLARALRTLAPDAPMILMTGYAQGNLLQGERLPMMKEILEKPVRPRDLREAVQRVLVDMPSAPRVVCERPGPARAESDPAAERRRLRMVLWGEEDMHRVGRG